MSDQVLLDEIERLKEKNAELVKSNKLFSRISTFVSRLKDGCSSWFNENVDWFAPITIVTLAVGTIVFAVAWGIGGSPTDHFYAEYERSRIRIYQKYDWGMDRAVWSEYNPGPGEAVQKLQQVKREWVEIKNFESTQ